MTPFPLSSAPAVFAYDTLAAATAPASAFNSSADLPQPQRPQQPQLQQPESRHQPHVATLIAASTATNPVSAASPASNISADPPHQPNQPRSQHPRQSTQHPHQPQPQQPLSRLQAHAMLIAAATGRVALPNLSGARPAPTPSENVSNDNCVENGCLTNSNGKTDIRDTVSIGTRRSVASASHGNSDAPPEPATAVTTAACDAPAYNKIAFNEAATSVRACRPPAQQPVGSAASGSRGASGTNERSGNGGGDTNGGSGVNGSCGGGCGLGGGYSGGSGGAFDGGFGGDGYSSAKATQAVPISTKSPLSSTDLRTETTNSGAAHPCLRPFNVVAVTANPLVRGNSLLVQGNSLIRGGEVIARNGSANLGDAITRLLSDTVASPPVPPPVPPAAPPLMQQPLKRSSPPIPTFSAPPSRTSGDPAETLPKPPSEPSYEPRSWPSFPEPLRPSHANPLPASPQPSCAQSAAPSASPLPAALAALLGMTRGTDPLQFMGIERRRNDLLLAAASARSTCGVPSVNCPSQSNLVSQISSHPSDSLSSHPFNSLPAAPSASFPCLPRHAAAGAGGVSGGTGEFTFGSLGAAGLGAVGNDVMMGGRDAMAAAVAAAAAAVQGVYRQALLDRYMQEQQASRLHTAMPTVSAAAAAAAGGAGAGAAAAAAAAAAGGVFPACASGSGSASASSSAAARVCAGNSSGNSVANAAGNGAVNAAASSAASAHVLRQLKRQLSAAGAAAAVALHASAALPLPERATADASGCESAPLWDGVSGCAGVSLGQWDSWEQLQQPATVEELVLQQCNKSKKFSPSADEASAAPASVLTFRNICYSVSVKQRKGEPSTAGPHFTRQDSTLANFARLPPQPGIQEPPVSAAAAVQADGGATGGGGIANGFRRKRVRRQILTGVNGEARSGEVTAIMGASGGGKTTLLNILAQRISSGRRRGTVKLDAAEVCAGTMRRVSAYVMQDDVLFPSLTVRETLMSAAELRLEPRFSRREKEEKVARLIDMLGLAKVENSPIGGETKR
ncbi:unnamed protein product [Closterium sp. Naga37s-1]|nr:unnamed protein product [Closterium sp. Naga37s-1]